MSRVLFVLENDYFPRDARVYNECLTLSGLHCCYVLAPGRRGEKLRERVESVQCYRYPHFEANSLKYLLFEYLVAAAAIAVLVPLITLIHRIRVVHVANPPDFIIPLVSWLKLFGTKFVFDVHDLSVETFKGKSASQSVLGRHLANALDVLESASIRVADLVIVTNASIEEHVVKKREGVPVHVVRNSNAIRFRSLKEVKKRKRDGVLNVGYFGVLADDEAAGLNNFFAMAEVLARGPLPYRLSIVGDGPGLSVLKNIATERRLDQHFRFYGYVSFPDAFELIKDFDFGVVTWGYLPKNHLHTAMKVMDYMCCAVPVCSLRLKEQLQSTQNIGIHADSFAQIAAAMIDVFQKPDQYESLRRETLVHFNRVLSWELQSRKLINAYGSLLNTNARLASSSSE
jgi:glycosyltransferase involved in cell wall biosynthesis